MKSKERIYFDYAATTPVDPWVEKAMRPYFGKIFGNPGSVHRFGQEASAAVFEARQKIAKVIGAANYQEIIFTGSATEANNLALRGISNFQFPISNKISNSKIQNPRIIVSTIEHESILETARDLKKEGVEVIYIPVNQEGIIDLKKLENALNERTILVSVMYANNEIGTIQPISEIANIISGFKENNELGIMNKGKNKNSLIPNSQFLIPIYPLFHTDAVQALQFLNCNVNDLGVDLMTISAHKIYGPKGMGALYIRNNELGIMNNGKNKNPPIPNSKLVVSRAESFLISVITGGGQEFGWRSGTENVPYIVGFGVAIELVERLKIKEYKRIKDLQDYFWQNIKKIFPKAKLNGSARLTTSGSATDRLPNNLNIYFPGSSAQDRCIELDLLGIAVSPGVACSARSAKHSYVIEALGFPERATGSLRFSFGRYTTKNEIDKTLKIMKKIARK